MGEGRRCPPESVATASHAVELNGVDGGQVRASSSGEREGQSKALSVVGGVTAPKEAHVLSQHL